jgi:hypothetical protein
MLVWQVVELGGSAAIEFRIGGLIAQPAGEFLVIVGAICVSVLPPP